MRVKRFSLEGHFVDLSGLTIISGVEGPKLIQDLQALAEGLPCESEPTLGIESGGGVYSLSTKKPIPGTVAYIDNYRLNMDQSQMRRTSSTPARKRLHPGPDGCDLIDYLGSLPPEGMARLEQILKTTGIVDRFKIEKTEAAVMLRWTPRGGEPQTQMEMSSSHLRLLWIVSTLSADIDMVFMSGPEVEQAPEGLELIMSCVLGAVNSGTQVLLASMDPRIVDKNFPVLFWNSHRWTWRSLPAATSLL